MGACWRSRAARAGGRAISRTENVSAALARADAYHLPFADRSFDCCFFGFWLSHVPSQLHPQFFGEVGRVVRAGGAVMLVDSKPFRGEAPGAQLKPERILNDGSRHQIVKIYHTPESLRNVLQRYGADVRTWTSGHFFTAGYYRIPAN